MTPRTFVNYIESHGFTIYRCNESGHSSRRWVSSVLFLLKFGCYLDVDAEWNAYDYVDTYRAFVHGVGRRLARYSGIASEEGSFFGFEKTLVAAEHRQLCQAYWRAVEAEVARVRYLRWAAGVASRWHKVREEYMASGYQQSEIQYVY